MLSLAGTNSNLEIRNPKQTQMTENQNSKQDDTIDLRIGVLVIMIFDFEFVSNFVFRISNFESGKLA